MENDKTEKPFSEQTPLVKVLIVVFGGLLGMAALGAAVLGVGLIWRAALSVW